MLKDFGIKRIFGNLSYLIASRMTNKFLFILLIIFISRILGVEGLGAYGFIFAFTGLIFPFSNIGSHVFIRDLVINKKLIHKFWGNFLILKSLNSLIIYFIAIIITLIYPIPEGLKHLIYLTGLILFWVIFSDVAKCIFISYQEMKSIFLAEIAGDSLIVILSVFFLLSGKGIFWIIISFATGEMIKALLLNFMLIKRFSKPEFKIDVKLCATWVKKGFYFIMQRQFMRSLLKIDILVIASMSSLYAVGLYQAPYKIALKMDIIPILFGCVFYPHYIKANQFSFKNLKSHYTKYKKYILIASIILGLFLFTFSKQIILLLYGKEFLRSILILKILVIAALFIGLNNNNKIFLNTIKKEKIVFFLSFFIFLLNLILDIILIKPYGIIGVAVVTVICSVIYFIITESYIRKVIKLKKKYSKI